jgi:hypothetical protein
MIDESNLAVQEACIKARHLWGNLKPEALAQAPKCLERAIELAPEMSRSYSGRELVEKVEVCKICRFLHRPEVESPQKASTGFQ